MEKKFKYLVADTTAFINNVQLNEYSDNIFTVPDVVHEVSHKRQIKRLAVLPFDLQVQEPDSNALNFVTLFSKKTGDYASLSAIDLKVIALTYQLEKTYEGFEHLREEPVTSKIIASKHKPKEFEDNTKLAGFYSPDNCNLSSNVSSTDSKEEEEQNTELSKCLKNLDLDEKLEEKNCEVVDPDTDENSDDESDNDDSSWVTPSNIQKIKKQYHEDLEEEKNVTVACMSTDFAIQNVLKQINLNIAALNGRVIKHLRTYILRCYGCFKTTSIVTKVFCPNCGNKTLKRVAVSLDENGQQVIHINTRRPLTNKYKNKSVARFKGGKHSRNPILYEDQPIPKQMPSRVAKTKTNALDDDYIAGFSPFVMRDVNSKSSLLRTQGNIKEWARNNTYEEDRRRKNCNRLVK